MQSILGNTRKADISFSRSGLICISASVAKALSLAHGDVIDIMDEQGEFLLFVKHRAPVVGRHVGMVFSTKKKSNHFRTSSVKLCRFIHHRCGATADKVSLCVGIPVEIKHYGTALPIIINHIL